MGQMDQTDQMDQKNTPTFACYTNIQGSEEVQKGKVDFAKWSRRQTVQQTVKGIPLRLNSKQKLIKFSILNFWVRVVQLVLLCPVKWSMWRNIRLIASHILCTNGPIGPNGPKGPKKADQILLAIQIHRDIHASRGLLSFDDRRLAQQFETYVENNLDPLPSYDLPLRKPELYGNQLKPWLAVWI